MQHWMHVARHCTLKLCGPRNILKINWRREWDSLGAFNADSLRFNEMPKTEVLTGSYVLSQLEQ